MKSVFFLATSLSLSLFCSFAQADAETEARERHDECVSKVPLKPEYSTFVLEMGIHQIFTDFLYVTMVDTYNCGVRSGHLKFYDQGSKLKKIKTAYVARGSMVQILNMEPRMFGTMESHIYIEKEYLKIKVLHPHSYSSKDLTEDAKIGCEGYILVDDLKRSAYAKVERPYDNERNDCFYTSGLQSAIYDRKKNEESIYEY